MSGVFEKVPLVERPPQWQEDQNTDAEAYRYFYCPKCKARHKYGHLREGIDCYRCDRHFCPSEDSYRRELDRITNLPIKDQDDAYQCIYGMPRDEYYRRREANEAAKQSRREAVLAQREADLRALRFAATWYGKLYHWLKYSFKKG